jgi:hypothetical protein
MHLPAVLTHQHLSHGSLCQRARLAARAAFRVVVLQVGSPSAMVSGCEFIANDSHLQVANRNPNLGSAASFSAWATPKLAGAHAFKLPPQLSINDGGQAAPLLIS